jgi:hypothetical protein
MANYNPVVPVLVSVLVTEEDSETAVVLHAFMTKA